MSWHQSFRTVKSALKWSDASDMPVGEPTLQVETKVTGVFPEFHQARALDDEGFEYALTSSTPGVDVRRLEQGQRLQCTVEVELRRVLRAEVIA